MKQKICKITQSFRQGIVFLLFITISSNVCIAATPLSDFIQHYQLHSLDGYAFSLSDFRNKVILIDFWDSENESSMSIIPEIAKLEEFFNMNLDVEIIAVNVGRKSYEDVKSFTDNTTYNLHFVYDKNSTITKALGVQELPTIIVIDKDFKYELKPITIFQNRENHIVDQYKRLINDLM